MTLPSNYIVEHRNRVSVCPTKLYRTGNQQGLGNESLMDRIETTVFSAKGQNPIAAE